MSYETEFVGRFIKDIKEFDILSYEMTEVLALFDDDDLLVELERRKYPFTEQHYEESVIKYHDENHTDHFYYCREGVCGRINDGWDELKVMEDYDRHCQSKGIEHD